MSLSHLLLKVFSALISETTCKLKGDVLSDARGANLVLVEFQDSSVFRDSLDETLRSVADVKNFARKQNAFREKYWDRAPTYAASLSKSTL